MSTWLRICVVPCETQRSIKAAARTGIGLASASACFSNMNPLADAEAGSAGTMGLPVVADKTLVEMDVAIDHARQQQAPAEIMRFAGNCLRAGDVDVIEAILTVAHANIDGASVGQSGVAKERV